MSENIGLRNIGITTTDIAIYEFKKMMLTRVLTGGTI